MKLYTNIEKQPLTNLSNDNDQQTGNTLNVYPKGYNANYYSQLPNANYQSKINNPYQLAKSAINLCQMPSHISLVDQKHALNQINWRAGSALRKTTSRQKIFNEENTIFKLAEPLVEHFYAQSSGNNAQNKNLKDQNQLPENPSSDTKTRQKSSTLQKMNQNLEKSLQIIFKGENKGLQPETVNQKKHAYQILSRPILDQEGNQKLQRKNKNDQSQLFQGSGLQAKIPQMIQRISRNQKQIKQISFKVDLLVKSQKEKNSLLLKELRQLKYKQKSLMSKQRALQSQLKHFKQQQKSVNKKFSHKSQKQMQQAKYIQQLVQENKMLQDKVWQQKSAPPKFQRQLESQYLRARIECLYSQRQILEKQKESRKSVQLQRRAVYFTNVNQQIATNNKKPDITVSSNQKNQNVYFNYPSQNHKANVRQVKVTKIY